MLFHFKTRVHKSDHRPRGFQCKSQTKGFVHNKKARKKKFWQNFHYSLKQTLSYHWPKNIFFKSQSKLGSQKKKDKSEKEASYLMVSVKKS